MILLFLIKENEYHEDIKNKIIENHHSYEIFIETYKNNETYLNIYEKYFIQYTFSKIIILDFYFIYKPMKDNSYILDYDTLLFYKKILHLYHSKEYALLIHMIEKYFENKKMDVNNNEFKSILTILSAKAKQYSHYTEYDIIETYAKSYELCNDNFIGIYELLVKCRLNNNYLLGYHYAQYYLNEFMPQLINDINGEKYNDFIENIILKSTYLNKENLFIYLFYLEFEMIIITLNLHKYDIAYQLCNRLLLRPLFDISEKEKITFKNIQNDMTKQIQYFQSFCIEHVKNKYIYYDQNKINFICNNQDSQDTQYTQDKSIIFTITTCKRFDLFEKTINSFINCTPEYDLKLIKFWLCVDDNSSIEDREKMKSKYPFFTFIWKNIEQKGHIPSMNIIREYVLNSGCSHTLHMEDDWQSVIYFNSLSRAFEIMEDDNTIKQVVYNKNYVQELCKRDIDLHGGIIKYVSKPNIKKRCQKYILHQFINQNNKEFKDYMISINDEPTNVNWPYYSLNPSILSVDVYKNCGIFEKITWHFEFDYAVKFLYAGFKTAFFNGISKLHIGKPLGSNEGKNAYELNNENKFIE